ncbi:MAG TPA: phosphoribosyltransferase family protein [Vicinamibacteria bacterium]|nr:phosphoribosyltransferase family protein [Vicinamibacteria bacterium]
MREATAQAFLDLVSARRGHFRMESGLHGGLWLDLDTLFANSWKVQPFVDALVAALEPYEIAAVCGPMTGGAFLAHWVAMALGLEFAFAERTADDGGGLYPARYRIPAALAARMAGRPVALVDDVMSAGSSLRATHEAVRAAGGHPIVAGTLLALGTRGVSFFEERDIRVEAVVRADFDCWTPDACPACASGVPLHDVAPGA